MREEELEEWTDLCRKALANMQVSSAGPTRSGKQLQTRVSFPWKGKWTTGYQTAERAFVMKSKEDSAVDFKSLLSGALRLHTAMMKAGHDRWKADGAFDEVWEALEQEGYKAKTLYVRQQIVQKMRESVRDADTKRDEVQLKKCRVQIPIWMQIALKHGIPAQELHEMVDLAVVKSVLKD